MRKTLLSELTERLGSGALPGAYSAGVLAGVQSMKHNEEDAEQTQMGGGDQSAGAAGEGQRRSETPKIDKARALFKGLISGPDATRADIITAFEQQLNVTNSTAVSYFQRLAKEAGLTNMGDGNEMTASDQGSGNDDPAAQTGEYSQMPDEDLELDDQIPDSGDPNKQGVIRTIPNAHMIYKRENEEGTYDELWVYNTGSKLGDELEIRRNILAGTDIPPRKTKSEDGNQHFTLTTMGNAQMLEITGLPQ